MGGSSEVSGYSPREAWLPGGGLPWAVVLAGGEGVRLRPLVGRVCGDERPKQFCPLLGRRTLLRETLDRVARLIPPERTVVVGLESHARYLAAEIAEGRGVTVLEQPMNRGTTAAVLLAAYWIEAHDPRAVVVVFPSDHFISQEARFMEHVAEVAGFVERQPAWIALLGVQPDEPETEYGWIEPAEPVAWTGKGSLFGVRQFREKPTPEVARILFQGGWLWNTSVFAADVGGLLAAGRECVPSMAEPLAQVSAFWGTKHEQWAIRQAYALAPTVSFSGSILEACSQPLAVSKVPEIDWCDLGSPERVLRTLVAHDISPPWLRTLTA